MPISKAEELVLLNLQASAWKGLYSRATMLQRALESKQDVEMHAQILSEYIKENKKKVSNFIDSIPE